MTFFSLDGIFEIRKILGKIRKISSRVNLYRKKTAIFGKKKKNKKKPVFWLYLGHLLDFVPKKMEQGRTCIICGVFIRGDLILGMKKVKKKGTMSNITTQGRIGGREKCGTLHDFACHPCAGAMLIFSVSFQF